jgi:hypothetical protein
VSGELNYKNLRSKIHNVQPPLIPFPGLYQGDLTFLDTCGKDILENGIINYQKFQRSAAYILEMKQYQSVSYRFQPVSEIQEYIKKFKPLNDAEAFKASNECEPK